MKKISVILIPLLAVLSLVGCSSSDEATRAGGTQVIRSSSKPIRHEEPEVQIIRRADRIQVSVWGYPEFNFADSVKESGVIAVPLIGEVNVVGMTKEEFIGDLSRRLAEYIQGEMRISVAITSRGMKEVTILGAVTRQESYPLAVEMSLLDAMALAGGTTPEADLRHVRILRSGPNRQPIEVDVLSFVEHGNVDAVPIIRPGDTIFIPREEDLIRELSTYLGSAIFLFSFFVLLR